MFSKEKEIKFNDATTKYIEFLSTIQLGINIAIEDESTYEGKGIEIRKEMGEMKKRLYKRKIKDGFLYVETEDGKETRLETKFKVGSYLYEEMMYIEKLKELVVSTSMNLETQEIISTYEDLMKE